jgi:sec-independent protein translocase protein TatC
MTPATQRAIAGFVVMATALFFAGVAFMYVIVLPRALDFLVGYDDQLYAEQVRASYFLSFVTLTMLAGGLAFEMPIFVLALVRIGVVSSSMLRSNRRIGYVAMLVFAILLPTVDPISLAFEVVPLVLLYELSIWLSAVMERRWERSYDETFEAP